MKHHTPSAGAPSLAASGTPLDVWLRRQMKAQHDSSLREPLPQRWLELVGQGAPSPGNWNQPGQNKP